MDAQQPIEVGNRKQLFIDDRWFATRHGVHLRMNPPVKAERVIAPEMPWEQKGLQVCHTIIEHDGEYKLWYETGVKGKRGCRDLMCYATSRDGVYFERRNVNLFEFDGSRDNNIVVPGGQAVVMLDPTGPDEFRFKMLSWFAEDDLWPEVKGTELRSYDIYVGTSPDGIHWTRPDRRPYIPLGLKGSYDGACIYMSTGMIRKGAEIWQYYLGMHYTHGQPEPYDPDLGPGGWLCRLVQRLDGFVSADADYTGAEFFTPTITFSGSQLELNVDCSAMGEVWVEILDANNVPVPGYTLKDSVSVDRNQIAAPVTWREHDNVDELIGRPVKLHVKLRACKLYAFQFAS